MRFGGGGGGGGADPRAGGRIGTFFAQWLLKFAQPNLIDLI